MAPFCFPSLCFLTGLPRRLRRLAMTRVTRDEAATKIIRNDKNRERWRTYFKNRKVFWPVAALKNRKACWLPPSSLR